MSYCANCSRLVDGVNSGGFFVGPFLFCSPMCRDTSEELRRYEQIKKLEKHARPRPHFLEACEEVRDELTAKGVNIRASDILGELTDEPNCGIPNCHVCSGAMRERKGDGS